MNLFIEYYKPSNIIRHGEFLVCLHENIENPLIDIITVFISDESKLFIKSSKTQIVLTQERPTFKFIFEYCNKYFNNEVCMIANADIVFDESIQVIKETNLDNLFLAISRWDIDKDGNSELYNNSASQDVWVFKTPLKVPEANFYTGGTGGPDNRLAYLMDELGYELRNPAKQIKVRHLHISKYRKVTSVIPGPYLCLEPNDNILIRPQHIKIKGFDELGQPICF